MSEAAESNRCPWQDCFGGYKSPTSTGQSPSEVLFVRIQKFTFSRMFAVVWPITQGEESTTHLLENIFLPNQCAAHGFPFVNTLYIDPLG